MRVERENVEGHVETTRADFKQSVAHCDLDEGPNFKDKGQRGLSHAAHVAGDQ